MALERGARLGPYHIDGQIGAGGIGGSGLVCPNDLNHLATAKALSLFARELRT